MAEFDRFAGTYQTALDADVGSAAYYADAKALAAERVLGAGFGGRLLDYGCGVGLLTNALRQRFSAAELTGFDVSADCIASISAELQAKARFVADSLAVGDGYDAAVVSNVLHHVPPAERKEFMASLAARLRPGGQLLVFEHNPLNPATRWIVAHCAFDDDAVLLWPAETARLLASAGLRQLRRDYVAFFPQSLRRLQPHERHLRRLPLGAQYLAWGCKP